MDEAARIRVATVVKRLHIAGDQIRVLTMAQELDHSRFEHVVIVVEAPDQERDERMGPMLERYRQAGVDVVVLGIELHSFSNAEPDRPRSMASPVLDLLASVRLVRGLAALLKNRGIHVVDARLELGTVLGVLAARLARVPVVVSTGYSPKFWRPPVLWALGQLSFALIDAFVSDARMTVDAYDRWRLSRRARMVVIPNGVYPALSAQTREDARSALGLPKDAIVVGHIGRLLPHKAHDVFIRAAAVVAEQEPRAAFIVCGFAEDLDYRSELLALVAQQGLTDRLVLTGHSGSMGEVFAALDILAHLSVFESSPLVVHEAMSASLPTVVTDVGGMTDLVAHNQTSLFVSNGDPDEAAAAMLQLIRDETLRHRLGAAARKRYEEAHRPELLARRHETLFIELLEQKRRTTRGRKSVDPATE